MSNVVRLPIHDDRPLTQIPPLAGFMAFKGVYALCDIRADFTLKVTHYTCCVEQGPNPMWAIWTANGKFLRFLGRRSQVQEAYPNKAWKRMMASWRLSEMVDYMNPAERRDVLVKAYKTSAGGIS